MFVVVYVAAITALNYLSMKGTSRINGILVVFQVVLIAAFVVQAWLALRNGMGEGTIFTLDPLYHEGVQMSAVVAGATVVCFSFIGFDAITMYSRGGQVAGDRPESDRPRTAHRWRDLLRRGVVQPIRVPDPRVVELAHADLLGLPESPRVLAALPRCIASR